MTNAMADDSDPNRQSPTRQIDLLDGSFGGGGGTYEVGYQRRSPARNEGSPRRSTPGRNPESNSTTPRPGESGEGAGSSESPPDYQVFIRNFKRSYDSAIIFSALVNFIIFFSLPI